MRTPLLTVIVTCYNLAPFIPGCLRSIFRQPQADGLKVLVIDDGSTDNTRQVVEAQIAAHPHIDCQLVVQPNLGVSAARNHGVRLTRTPYLTFFDGDDTWAENYLERLMPFMDEGRADIVAFNARRVDMTGRRLPSLNSHTLFTSRARFSCAQLALDAAATGEWHTYLRIFRTRLLDGIFFIPGRQFEDGQLLPQLYARASHIETLDEELYVYLRRPNSLISCIRDKEIDDLLLNVRDAAAHIPEQPDFWSAVHRRTLLQIAGDIGRAPRGRRRAMISRVWPEVQARLDLGTQMRWLLRMLGRSVRSDVKQLIGWNALRAR